MKVTLVCLTTLFSVVALARGFVPKQHDGKRAHTVTFFVLRKNLQHESKHVSSDAFLWENEESFFDNKYFKLEKETLREMDEIDSTVQELLDDNLDSPEDCPDLRIIKKATIILMKAKRTGISFGMMRSHSKPLKNPARSTETDQEECEETFTDFATGDELCYASDGSLKSVSFT
jgi:hypothetical protein